MRIQLGILGGLAGYMVWASSFADVTRDLVTAISF